MQECAGTPRERCGIDLSGPWPLSKEGNQYLCVLQDNFFKWIEVYAMQDKKALSVARYGQVCASGQAALGFGNGVPG